jgi:hypothetical protein
VEPVIVAKGKTKDKGKTKGKDKGKSKGKSSNTKIAAEEPEARAPSAKQSLDELTTRSESEAEARSYDAYAEQ